MERTSNYFWDHPILVVALGGILPSIVTAVVYVILAGSDISYLQEDVQEMKGTLDQLVVIQNRQATHTEQIIETVRRLDRQDERIIMLERRIHDLTKGE